MRIQKFFDEMFGTLQIIEDAKTGELWFVANEVAKMLGYKNISDAILKHTAPEDRKTLNIRDYRETRLSVLWPEGDFRPKVLINESAVYCLIFGSHLESAKDFKLWVTRTVLPSVRQNGGYVDGQEGLSSEERESLLSEIRTLSSKVAYLQKRRHELKRDVRDLQDQKRVLKAQKKGLVASNEKYREACIDQLDLYLKVLKENARYSKQEFSARWQEEPSAKRSYPEERTVRVDACGFIIG